jgi:hypothetical protein
MYKRSPTRMISARNAASNPLWFGMLVVDVSEIQANLPPECGQHIALSVSNLFNLLSDYNPRPDSGR